MAFAVSADQFMFQTHEDDNHPLPNSSILLPPYTSQHYHGASLAQMGKSVSFSGMEADDDTSDDGSQLGERKRRLSTEQVRALEKSFELGNKLEPERKVQLARALGLHPRQIAIWFQNRRARWKTKKLERDYEMLKRQFEALKAENDSLQAQNRKLHAELLALKGRESGGTGSINLNRETEASWSNNGSENSCDVNFGNSHHQIGVHSSIGAETSITHLLQGSSRSANHCQRIDPLPPDEGFCNMFGSIEDPTMPGFWPWPEQQQFH
ncbi:hypothetical protein NMG60_11028407 [Bertholletia excelsa]